MNLLSQTCRSNRYTVAHYMSHVRLLYGLDLTGSFMDVNVQDIFLT